MTTFYSFVSNLTGLNHITNSLPGKDRNRECSDLGHISHNSVLSDIQSTPVSLVASGRSNSQEQLRDNNGSDINLNSRAGRPAEAYANLEHISMDNSANPIAVADYSSWEKYGLSEDSNSVAQAEALIEILGAVCVSNVNSSQGTLLSQVEKVTRQFLSDLMKPFPENPNQKLEALKECIAHINEEVYEILEDLEGEFSKELHKIMDNDLAKRSEGLDAEIELFQKQFQLSSDLLKVGNGDETSVNSHVNVQKVYTDLNQSAAELLELNRRKKELDICKSSLDKEPQTGYIHQKALDSVKNNFKFKILNVTKKAVEKAMSVSSSYYLELIESSDRPLPKKEQTQWNKSMLLCAGAVATAVILGTKRLKPPA